MARRRAAREGLDDDHAAAATWTCRLVVIRSIGIGRFALRLWPSEQFAGARDVVGAGGLGQQAVVADAVEALRQDVNEESADELVCGKCHLLVSISALRVAMASDVPTRSFSPEVSPSALSTRPSSTCSELNVSAAARFLDMGGTSPLRVPRIGPAFRFARRAKISARSAERWPVQCGLLRWTAMEQTR